MKSIARGIGGLSLLGVMLLTPAAVRAAQPFSAEDAGTVGAGVAELEVSSAASAVAGGHLGGLDFVAAAHVGLHDRLDLGAEFGFAWGEVHRGVWQSGAGAPVVDAKWRVIPADEDGAPELALKLTWSPPDSGDGDAAGHGLGLIAAFTWARGDWEWVVDGAVEGCAGAHDGGDTRWRTGTTGVWHLSDLVHVGVDIALHAGGGAPVGLDLLAGARFHVTAQGVASVGVGVPQADDGTRGWVATVAWTESFGAAVE